MASVARAAPWRATLVVGLSGLLLTMLAIQATHRDREEIARAESLRLSERVVIELARRLMLPLCGLKGARGVFATVSKSG